MEEIGWGKMIKTTLSGYISLLKLYYENYWEEEITTSSNQSKVG